ncbi:MAG: hypothetical protein NZ770_06070 [Candidatus Poseidoniaceae archaeon]|jgi:hypothetical protein|nr:hypothetical protein [Candidatus Poseidoniaceae archaeon]
MRVVPSLIGLILLSVAIFGAIGLSGGGSAEANVPACIPPAACDAGVSHETLDIPSLAGLLDVSTSVQWSEGSAWIGVIKDELPSSCVSLPSHVNCDEDELVFVAGGPGSGGSFSWNAEPGSYRFASGSSAIQSSLRGNTIDYTWDATLGSGMMYSLFAIGGTLMAWGLKPSSQ